MWLDEDSPGCFYDTIDCSDCGGCNPSPLELYLEEKSEEVIMKDMTLINVILDRSGSMGTIGTEAVGMFNTFLKEQKELKDYAELSLIQFDSYYEVNYLRRPIKECVDLVYGDTYQPRSMTALLDAIGKCINDVEQEINKIPEWEKPKRVLFMILTDGEENNSKEFSSSQINKMIEDKKEKSGWDFVFMASGISADKEGAKFGLGGTKCADFDFSPSGIKDLGSTMSAYTATYRSSGNTEMSVKSFIKD